MDFFAKTQNSQGKFDEIIKFLVISAHWFNPIFFLQFTKKTPMETKGSPTIKETVNSSLRRRMPKRTPKTGVKKVKAESLLTEYSWISLNQMK